jgi:hypothetical protein
MMDDTTRAALVLIREAAEVLADLEGQDLGLTLEMTVAMLGELLEAESALELVPDVAAYVRRYCDVLDGPADADPIASEILDRAAAAAAEHERGPREDGQP